MKTKKVLIKGYYGVNNLGDDLILNSICRSIVNSHPEYDIIVSGTGKLIKQSISEEYISNHVNGCVLPNGIIRLLHFFYTIDYFIYGGGGLFPNESLKQLLSTLRLFFIAKIMGTKICIYGIEINPIKKISSKIIWRIISVFADFISTRNQQTADLLISCGCSSKKIIESSDCTFSYLDVSEINNETESLNNIILWAPNNLFRESELKQKAIQHRYDLICSELALLCDSYPSYKHIFLPFYPQYDIPYIRDITNKIKKSSFEIVDINHMNALEKRSLFKKANMTICGRFHSIIFSLFYGIPFFAISYSPKTSSLLTELGLDENYVEYGIRESNFFYKAFDLDYLQAEKKIDNIIQNIGNRALYLEKSQLLQDKALSSELILIKWIGN